MNPMAVRAEKHQVRKAGSDGAGLMQRKRVMNLDVSGALISVCTGEVEAAYLACNRSASASDGLKLRLSKGAVPFACQMSGDYNGAFVCSHLRVRSHLGDKVRSRF